MRPVLEARQDGPSCVGCAEVGLVEYRSLLFCLSASYFGETPGMGDHTFLWFGPGVQSDTTSESLTQFPFTCAASYSNPIDMPFVHYISAYCRADWDDSSPDGFKITSASDSSLDGLTRPAAW